MSVFCLLIIYVFCEFIEITYCVSEPNSTAWSTINLLVDSRDLKNGFANAVHTTETYGIIIKSHNSSNFSSASSTVATPNLWTKIEVSKPPQRTTAKTSLPEPLVKYHAKLGAAKNQSREHTVRSETTSNGKVVERTTTKIRSTGAENASTEVPRKGVNGETGHAFFYDDDDDDDDYYDDDDDDDYDDDGYRIKNQEDDEEVEEEVIEPIEAHADEPIEAAETEAQEEYESYPETRPPIILRTRRKNKPKRGKKHSTVKIKDFKKLRKFLLPLLLAYKLKFFTLVPLLLGGLVLIVATTGFAGFFFALFAVGLGLRTGGQH